MVFEQLFKFKHIQHNSFNLFIMGFIFSELGILSSLLVFRNDAHLMSIAFTAAIAVPFLFNILEIKNIEVSGEQSFFKAVFNNNKYIFNSYLMLFLGFLLSYAIFAMLLPDFISLTLFRGQLNVAGLAGGVITALTGNAIKSFTFLGILKNNLGVLLVCFLFSVVFGVGSILFLIWNASAWGAILGFISKQSAIVINQNPIVYFFNQLIRYFPHLIVEAAAYFFAIISGVVISQTIINEKFNSDKFRFTMLEGLSLFFIGIVLLVIAAFIEVQIFPHL